MDSESLSESRQGAEAWVLLAPLNAADISHCKASTRRQRLLAQPGGLAETPDVGPDDVLPTHADMGTAVEAGI